jgi:hypothetical protein
MVQPGSHQLPMPPLRRHRGDTAQRSLPFDSGPARTATSRAVSSGSSLVAAPGPLGRRASQLNQNVSGPNVPHAIVTSGRQRRDRVGVRGHDRRQSVAPERHAAPSIWREPYSANGIESRHRTRPDPRCSTASTSPSPDPGRLTSSRCLMRVLTPASADVERPASGRHG